MLTKEERAAIAERLKSTEYITSSTLFKALTGEEKLSETSHVKSLCIICSVILGLCDTSNMLELPRDKDGEVIRVGDVVYDEDGDKYEVMGYEVDDSETNIILDNEPGSVSISAAPNELTHKQPVTAKSLAQRIRGVLDGICNTGYAVEELSDIAMQLERLGDNDD